MMANKMNTLLVGGLWNSDTGRQSSFVSKLGEVLARSNTIAIKNGGTLSELDELVSKDGLAPFNVVIWMPNIDNSVVKYLPKIKDVNPKCILVSSKRNDGGKYSFLELIARALKVKANLFLVFEKASDKISSSVYDPLGNAFCQNTESIDRLAEVLLDRIGKIVSMTRCSSRSIGEVSNPIVVSDKLKRFFAGCKDHASTFHSLIHSANPGRFLGNLSFRCEKGFPSFRDNGVIWVSKRNIDKREIVGYENMVPCKDQLFHNFGGSLEVQYWGQNKPSVDTPIQIGIYQRFDWVNYIIHSHVYIEGALTTSNVVPCGALQELSEILAVLSKSYPLSGSPFGSGCAALNLKGHGSILFANEVDAVPWNCIPFRCRPMPENQETIQ